MPRTTHYIVIRKIGSEELSVVRTMKSYQPQNEPGFTWGGPYPSAVKAMEAIERKDEALRQQLYPETQS